MKVLFYSALCLLAFCLGGVLSWLGGSASPESSGSASAAPLFRMAMVLPGSIDDASWNAAGYGALREVAAELGVRTAYSDRVSAEQARGLLDSYARESWDLVVAHGNEYREAVEALAPLYPRTDFMLVGDLPGNNRNLGAVGFHDAEGYFLAGALAGLASEAGRVALLVGVIYPHDGPVVDFFRQGAEWVRPGVEVEIRSLGGWEAFEEARREVADLIESGYDVLGVNVDAPGALVHRMACERGVRTIGWCYQDQGIDDACVVGLVRMRLDRLLSETVRLAMLGRIEGKQYLYGVQQGIQALELREGKLPPEAIGRLQALHEALEIGRMQVSLRYGAHFVESPMEMPQPWPQSANPDKP